MSRTWKKAVDNGDNDNDVDIQTKHVGSDSSTALYTTQAHTHCQHTDRLYTQ